MRDLVEIDPNLTLDKIAPIHQSSVWILERETMVQAVELPVLNACLVLYDKNIKTVVSSANVNHIATRLPAYITLDTGTMYGENRDIAREVCETTSDGRELAGILVPLPEDLSVLKISESAVAVAERFKLQSNAWAGLTLVEVQHSWGNIIGQQGAGLRMTAGDFVREGYFYDPGIDLLFKSQEHLRKAQAFKQG